MSCNDLKWGLEYAAMLERNEREDFYRRKMFRLLEKHLSPRTKAPEEVDSQPEQSKSVRTKPISRTEKLNELKMILDGSNVDMRDVNTSKHQRKSQKKRRGAKGATPAEKERDHKIVSDWEIARENGMSRGEFCQHQGITEIRELERIQDRCRKRNVRES